MWFKCNELEAKNSINTTAPTHIYCVIPSKTLFKTVRYDASVAYCKARKKSVPKEIPKKKNPLIKIFAQNLEWWADSSAPNPKIKDIKPITIKMAKVTFDFFVNINSILPYFTI
jgi:hypothetical protein